MVFYDKDGEPIVYTEDGIHLFFFNGIPAGYIEKDSIYSYSGIHLGWFIDNSIWDSDGDCVFFTKDSKKGPTKPLTQLKPFKEMKEMIPMKELKELKPLKPITTLNWSPLSPEEFFQL